LSPSIKVIRVWCH